jgi:hypothetical protein
MSTVTTSLPALPPVGRRVRAYFAPVNRAQKLPTLFDPSVNGRFPVDTPPAPWIDLGWIENFTRKSASKFGELVTGNPGTTQFQVRESIDATVSFQFKAWTKLSMALAAGSQHMNLLLPASGAAANASGSKGAPATNLVPGSTPTFVAMAASDAAGFAAGSLVTVDLDYTGQIGFVGSGVSAAYVSGPGAVNNDPDYVRRVSFNVARIASNLSNGLQLAQPLLAGTPAANMRVQSILGFVDREGGSFFQEWSALFVIDGQQGERILFHYPRLQSTAGPAENASALAPSLERLALSASLRALPVVDPNDGESVVCFRSFLPSPATLV